MKRSSPPSTPPRNNEKYMKRTFPSSTPPRNDENSPLIPPAKIRMRNALRDTVPTDIPIRRTAYALQGGLDDRTIYYNVSGIMNVSIEIHEHGVVNFGRYQEPETSEATVASETAIRSPVQSPIQSPIQETAVRKTTQEAVQKTDAVRETTRETVAAQQVDVQQNAQQDMQQVDSHQKEEEKVVNPNADAYHVTIDQGGSFAHLREEDPIRRSARQKDDVSYRIRQVKKHE